MDEEQSLSNEFIEILFVPQVRANLGFGHLRRILALMRDMEQFFRVKTFIYIEKESFYQELGAEIAQHILIEQLLHQVSKEKRWSLIVLDYFQSDASFAHQWREYGSVVALDEGGMGRTIYPYLIDILPRCKSHSLANEDERGYLRLNHIKHKTHHSDGELRVLLTFGGSDQAQMTEVVGNFLASINFPSKQWSVVKGPLFKRTIAWPGVKVMEHVDMAEIYQDFDIVFTHFGITAYEALAAGCWPILLNPTQYHEDLAMQEGFFSLGVKEISKKRHPWLKRCLQSNSYTQVMQAMPVSVRLMPPRSLAVRLMELTAYKHACPVCASNKVSSILYRTHRKSYAECAECGMLYLMLFVPKAVTYDATYFDDSYRKQYGKSYLEDFEHIKKMGMLRLKRAMRYHPVRGESQMRLLDIGCAYGPFLQAGADAGLQVYGVDTAKEVVDYVVNELGFSAQVANFPQDLPYAHQRFDFVTMWYVIEHFEQLDVVMRQVNRYLNVGGIFAFSTPKGDGLSAKKDLSAFLEASPDDHYTIFRKAGLRFFLERYGLELLHIETTGVHVQRKYAKILSGSWQERLLKRLFTLRGLGDTFEIYARKKRDLDDE